MKTWSHESESGKGKTETGTQWTEKMHSQPFAPLLHKFTGGGRVLQPQTTSHGRLTPSTNWLKMQNSDRWLQKKKKG